MLFFFGSLLFIRSLTVQSFYGISITAALLLIESLMTSENREQAQEEEVLERGHSLEVHPIGREQQEDARQAGQPGRIPDKARTTRESFQVGTDTGQVQEEKHKGQDDQTREDGGHHRVRTPIRQTELVVNFRQGRQGVVTVPQQRTGVQGVVDLGLDREGEGQFAQGQFQGRFHADVTDEQGHFVIPRSIFKIYNLFRQRHHRVIFPAGAICQGCAFRRINGLHTTGTQGCETDKSLLRRGRRVQNEVDTDAVSPCSRSGGGGRKGPLVCFGGDPYFDICDGGLGLDDEGTLDTAGAADGQDELVGPGAEVSGRPCFFF